jgi:hypothetical protein
MNMTFRILRYVWAAPATAVGLAAAAAAICVGARPRVVRGVIEVGDGKLGTFMQFVPGFFRFEAITFGHVVLGRDHAALSCLREHERVHVRQYERWGLFFFPLYAGSSLWQLLCGRDPYLHNAFEIEAFRVSDIVNVHHQSIGATENRNPL